MKYKVKYKGHAQQLRSSPEFSIECKDYRHSNSDDRELVASVAAKAQKDGRVMATAKECEKNSSNWYVTLDRSELLVR